jgi:uncharacterized protein (TIGR00106 family)
MVKKLKNLNDSDMNAIAEFSVTPLGAGVSLSPYVAECERILQERGIKHLLHANGTNIEGKWDELMGAIKECQARLHEMGVPRIQTFIKIATRIDREQTMAGKVESVKEKLTKE